LFSVCRRSATLPSASARSCAAVPNKALRAANFALRFEPYFPALDATGQSA